MPSITSWTQLIPQTRDENLASALQAKIHDPLWLMGRQWQLGEFLGEDAASPVVVDIHASGTPINRYYPGFDDTVSPMASQLYDSQTTPLEALVEQESISTNPEVYNWRAAAESGQHFCRLLRQHGVGQYCSGYTTYFPLEATDHPEGTKDEASARFLNIMAKRAPNGKKLYATVNGYSGHNLLPPRPVVASEDQAIVNECVSIWMNWYRARYIGASASNSSWNPERMEYSFGVSAANSTEEHILRANEYHGGKLDWYAFDLYRGNNTGTSTHTSPPVTITQSSVPTSVGFKGMPASRWWEFEDAQVNFGSFSSEPTDLIRMIFMEFALSYGNDWFIVPLALEKGNIYTTQAVVVTDTFGRKTLIKPYHEIDTPDSPWRMYCLANDRLSNGTPPVAPEQLLVLPPSLASSLNSKAIEEIHLLRDEMANMAWAVEHAVENGLGRPLSRHEAYQKQQYIESQESGTQVDHTTSALKYHLLSSVPDYWIPLIPSRISSASSDIRLRRGQLIQDANGQAASPEAKGQLLTEISPLDIYEEEVPRAGAQIMRHYQYARWLGGSNHLWQGRRKSMGRGEGWSGLKFDTIKKKIE